ncbi:DUF2617 family protein [Spiractinospora alimapuensis]|uniref:DUF2617 family protein n=1 Tax=Spiractinospora alimapuensis TaxID=2820884 RepID=UPI001F36C737|nr:DUF2617 family protein [Spiractinospora alimapuensis]QVQ53456.1 DUF2617 family protein [Spiractinospora alimapuensis]
MSIALSVPFVDTRASDLVWTLDHPRVPHLVAHTLERWGARVELRILGASHQVIVTGRPDAAAPLVETVACLPGHVGHLPHAVSRGTAAGRYQFSANVETVPSDQLVHRVAALRRAADANEHGLAAAFPGDPLALTVLLVDAPSPGTLSWRTWHTYPQHGELVSTATTIALPERGERREEFG